jgi:hypothetical protein
LLERVQGVCANWSITVFGETDTLEKVDSGFEPEVTLIKRFGKILIINK